MWKQLGPAFRITLLFTILTGAIYPGIITALSQLLFPRAANGSLVAASGRAVGSSLIGQNFSKPEYFHPRPSAAGSGYDASTSSGSNLGPTSKKLIDRIQASIEQFRKENPDYNGPIPADLVTASASGLDPDISIESAIAQAFRIAKARHVRVDQIVSLINATAAAPQFGLLGEPRVNVLRMNLALDQQYPR